MSESHFHDVCAATIKASLDIAIRNDEFQCYDICAATVGGNLELVDYVLTNWDLYERNGEKHQHVYVPLIDMLHILTIFACEYNHMHIIRYLFEKDCFTTYYHETHADYSRWPYLRRYPKRLDVAKYVKPNPDVGLKHSRTLES